MKTSDFGVGLIKQCEGLRLSAYRDIIGVWTIGYGTTHGVLPGMVISRAQAESLLRASLTADESFLNAVLRRPVAQKMFDALMCFTYNVGQGGLQKSSALRLTNMGDYVNAADALLLWNKAGGLVVPALSRRRHLERTLYMQGITDLHNEGAMLAKTSVPAPPAQMETAAYHPPSTLYAPQDPRSKPGAHISQGEGAAGSDDPTDLAPLPAL